MAAPTMADYLEFQEFKRWKQMTSAPPVAPKPLAAPLAAPAHTFVRQVRKIDYEWAWKHLFTGCAVGRQSEHRGMWYYFKNLYLDHPERFSLVGELHGFAPNQYISVVYSQPNKMPVGGELTISFHIYGQVMGTKFMMSSCDVKMGDVLYKRAWLPKAGGADDETSSQASSQRL